MAWCRGRAGWWRGVRCSWCFWSAAGRRGPEWPARRRSSPPNKRGNDACAVSTVCARGAGIAAGRTSGPGAADLPLPGHDRQLPVERPGRQVRVQLSVGGVVSLLGQQDRWVLARSLLRRTIMLRLGITVSVLLLALAPAAARA